MLPANPPMTGKELSNRVTLWMKLPVWKVFTFNSNRRVPTGMIGFCDHVALNLIHLYVVFIEVKGKGDTYSEEQLFFRECIESIAEVTKRVRYKLVENENDILEIIGE